MLSTASSSELLYSWDQKESESENITERQDQFTRSICCSPEFRLFRYLICILASIMNAMFVYSVDFPVGIEPIFIQVMELDHSQFN